MRPVGAPLVRGLVVGGAAYAAGRGAAGRRRGEQDQNEAIAALQAQVAAPAGTAAPAAPAVAVVAAAQPGQAASAVPTASGLPTVPAVPAASAVPAVPTASAGAPDIADKLADLGRMAQQGLLTPEEFATAKARLLGG
ncbi:SHOCT domain-containing protein [Streptomyces sp. CB01881]|nr:hypothetical protein C2142_07080 [Streptomyces sp. CB01881]TYC77887.1 SHOCT domain-containing protein [Streptomyces sp. CB01881]